MAVKHRTFKKKRRIAPRNKKLPRKLLPLSTYRLTLLHPQKKVSIFNQPCYNLKKRRLKKKSHRSNTSLSFKKNSKTTPQSSFRKPRSKTVSYRQLRSTKRANQFKFLLGNAFVKRKKTLFFKKHFSRKKLFVKIIKQPTIADWLSSYKRRRYLMRASRISENYRIIKSFRNNYRRNKADIVAPLRLFYNTTKIRKHSIKGSAILKYFYIKKNRLQRRRARAKILKLPKYLKRCKLRILRMRYLRRKSKLMFKKWRQRLLRSMTSYRLALKKFHNIVNQQQAKLASKYDLSVFRSKRLYLYRLDLLQKLQKYQLSRVLHGLDCVYWQIRTRATKCLKLHFRFKNKAMFIRRTVSQKLLRIYLNKSKKLRVKKNVHTLVRKHSLAKRNKNKFLPSKVVIYCKKLQESYADPENIQHFLTSKPLFYTNNVVPTPTVKQKSSKPTRKSASFSINQLRKLNVPRVNRILQKKNSKDFIGLATEARSWLLEDQQKKKIEIGVLTPQFKQSLPTHSLTRDVVTKKNIPKFAAKPTLLATPRMIIAPILPPPPRLVVIRPTPPTWV